MPRCELVILDCAVVAELTKATAIPHAGWKRSEVGSEYIYRRPLNRKELQLALKNGSLVDQGSFAESLLIQKSDAVDLLVVDRRMSRPSLSAEYVNDEIKVSVQLDASQSSEGISLSSSLIFKSDHEYIISAGRVVFFEKNLLKKTYRLLDLNLNQPAAQVSMSYRKFLLLRKEARESGIKLFVKFDEQEILSSLRESKSGYQITHSHFFQCDLRSYQEKALNWLQFCYHYELGALLAFDMGLGKTCTTVGLLAHAKSQHSEPSLVVCPLSLVSNWKAEIERFAPGIDVWVNHGDARSRVKSHFKNKSVVLTSYETVRSDVELLSDIDWNVVVLDEAQRIKNPGSSTSLSCRRLTSRCPVALTGTPFENRPLDLWSLMDFLEPGYLGDKNHFDAQFSIPISRGNNEVAEQLKSKVDLFMFRKMKDDVLSELPALTEIELPISMSDWESRCYKKMLDQSGRNRANFGVITKLRQFCAHPSLIEDEFDYGDDVYESCKYAQLLDVLRKIKPSREKVIVFTAWLPMLDLLQKELPKQIGGGVFRIDGDVKGPDRDGILQGFKEHDGFAVLIGNHQTLGVGLNITSANHVIHYCGAWNPAVLDQATARALRMGQKKPVFSYTFFYVDTVDSLIWDVVKRKRELGEHLISDDLTKDLTNDDDFCESVLKIRPGLGQDD